MNVLMDELTSNMNDEHDEFFWDFKHFLRFFTLEYRTDRQTDELASLNITRAEYDDEIMNESTSNMNDEWDEFLSDSKHFLRFETLVYEAL